MDGGGGGGYEDAQMEGEGYDQHWDDEEEDEWDENPQDEGGGELTHIDTREHDSDT